MAPLLASVGACVPQLSGRGLGHTGGTLDKLESIPGFRTSLGADEMLEVLGRVGCVICAAGPGLAPADRKLYALRDVTGTVESIPLIASSIMSKKIAEGTGALVLDVKVGRGAFMPDVASARRLGETMVAIGAEHGVATAAFLTRMDQPLGRAVGNALEVRECIETLRGAGPDDLVELSLDLALEMARLAGLELAARPDARHELRAALADGRALGRFEAMVRAQTGDPDTALPVASHVATVAAPGAGYVQALDARVLGEVAWRLGAGRARKEDAVSASAGIVCLAKAGDAVEKGQAVVELHADDPRLLRMAEGLVEGAMRLAPEPPEPVQLVVEVIRA